MKSVGCLVKECLLWSFWMGRKTDKVEERMTTDVFNQRDKIAAPPFVTVAIKDEETRR